MKISQISYSITKNSRYKKSVKNPISRSQNDLSFNGIFSKDKLDPTDKAIGCALEELRLSKDKEGAENTYLFTIPEEAFKSESITRHTIKPERCEGCVPSENWGHYSFPSKIIEKDSDIQKRHIIEERKRLTQQGIKSYLDNGDFEWEFDEERKVASIWTLNPRIVNSIINGYDSNDAKKLIAKYLFHLEDDEIKKALIIRMSFFYRYNGREKAIEYFNLLKPYINGWRKEAINSQELIGELQSKYIKGDVELAIQKNKIQIELFEAIEKEAKALSQNNDSQNTDKDEIKIPNGILISGKSELSINDLLNWIKSKKSDHIRVKTVEYNADDPKDSIAKLTEALEEAASYWGIAGKRTILDISSYENLLTGETSPKKRIAIGRFKNLAENASKNYHTTLVLSANKNQEEIEPSAISGQRFNIKVKLDSNPLTEEEDKQLTDAKAKLKELDEAKYYLQDLFLRRRIYAPDHKKGDNFDAIYEKLISHPYDASGLMPSGLSDSSYRKEQEEERRKAQEREELADYLFRIMV